MRLFVFSLCLAVLLVVATLFVFEGSALRLQLLWILAATVGGASVIGLIVSMLDYRLQWKRQNHLHSLRESWRRVPRVSIVPRKSSASVARQTKSVVVDGIPTAHLAQDQTEPQESTSDARFVAEHSLALADTASLEWASRPVAAQEATSEPVAAVVVKQDVFPSVAVAEQDVSPSVAHEGKDVLVLPEPTAVALSSTEPSHAPNSTNGVEHVFAGIPEKQEDTMLPGVAGEQVEAAQGPADQVLYLARDFDLSEVKRVFDIWKMNYDEQAHDTHILGRWSGQDGTLVEVLHDKDGSPCIEIRGPMADELAEFLPQDLPVYPLPQRTHLV